MRVLVVPKLAGLLRGLNNITEGTREDEEMARHPFWLVVVRCSGSSDVWQLSGRPFVRIPGYPLVNTALRL